MDYSHLRFEAVIDWIEFEIQTLTPTNFMTVQKALREFQGLPDDAMPYVMPLDEGEGRAATIYRFRVQDLKRFQAVKSILSRAEKRFGFQVQPRITGIEVAFDTYRVGASARQLAEIITDRYRFSTAIPEAGSWYFYRKTGEGRGYIKTLEVRNEVVKRFESGWQLTDTNYQTADCRFHLYVKTTDNKARLPVGQHRARFEVALKGEAAPCKTFEELEHFNFEKLAHLFNFRRYADNLHPMAKYALTKCAIRQSGARGKYLRIHGGRRAGSSVFRWTTIADDRLNKTVRMKLAKLTRGWKSKRAA